MLPMSFVVLRNQNGQYKVNVMLIIVYNNGLPLEFHEKKKLKQNHLRATSLDKHKSHTRVRSH